MTNEHRENVMQQAIFFFRLRASERQLGCQDLSDLSFHGPLCERYSESNSPGTVVFVIELLHDFGSSLGPCAIRKRT